MDKLRQNLTIYDNLLEGQVNKLSQPGDAGFEQLKSGILRQIEEYIDKNLK